MNRLGLIILFTLPVLVFSQKEDLKLNRHQRQHLDVFVKTQYAIREGKVPSDTIFKAFYTFIASSNKEALTVNRERAEKLMERANKALTDGKNTQVKRFEAAARLYNNLVKINEEIVEAFEKNNSSKMTYLMMQYVALEKEMVEFGLERPPRDWFTPQEAEKLMVAQAKMKSNK